MTQSSDVRIVTEKALATPGYPANTTVQALIAAGLSGGGGAGGGIVLIEAAATVPPVGTPAGTVVARKAASAVGTAIDSYLFDGFTEGATPTGTGAWSVSGSTGTFQALAAAANHGAKGGRMSGMTLSRMVFFSETETTTSRTISAAYKFTAWPSGGTAYVMNATTGASGGVAWVGIEVDGHVRIRNGNTTIATSSSTLALNTWYRFEWKLIHTPTPTQELRVYPSGSTSVLYDLSGTASLAPSHNGFNFGIPASPNTMGMDMDDFRIGNDWLGPFGGASAAGSGLGWWDGSTILNLAPIT